MEKVYKNNDAGIEKVIYKMSDLNINENDKQNLNNISRKKNSLRPLIRLKSSYKNYKKLISETNPSLSPNSIDSEAYEEALKECQENRPYAIGLDIGSDSVGWAVINPETGELYETPRKLNPIERMNKETGIKYSYTWGSRLFSAASTAQDRRVKRSGRRRLRRRKQRLLILQKLFAQEIAKVDPDFFIRLKYSPLDKNNENAVKGFESLFPSVSKNSLVKEISKDIKVEAQGSQDINELGKNILFSAQTEGSINGTSLLSDKDFHAKYPTIYHLRDELVRNKEKADIRLVYLALHHLIKYRGNFLYEEEGDSWTYQGNISSEEIVEDYERYWEEYRQTVSDDEAISELDKNDLREAIDDLLEDKEIQKDKAVETAAKEIYKAITGKKFKLSTLFPTYSAEEEKTVSLKGEDAELEKALPSLSGYAQDTIQAFERAYSSYLLLDLFRFNKDKNYLSAVMIGKYNAHKNQLAAIKKILKNNDEINGTKDYDLFFKKVENSGSKEIDREKYSYVSYVGPYSYKEDQENKWIGKCSQEDLLKNLLGSFKENSPVSKFIEQPSPVFYYHLLSKDAKKTFNTLFAADESTDISKKINEIFKDLLTEAASLHERYSNMQEDRMAHLYDTSLLKNLKEVFQSDDEAKGNEGTTFSKVRRLEEWWKEFVEKDRSDREKSEESFGKEKSPLISYNDLSAKARDIFNESLFKISNSSEDLLMKDILQKPRSGENIGIPYQIQLDELEKIIDNQKEYYDFLRKDKDLIKNLLSTRLPYWVGPLNTKSKFAWVSFREDEDLTKSSIPDGPWNYKDIDKRNTKIDANATAENFISRMLGKDTYLYLEDVLPKNSLIYEIYCVLSELNGVKTDFDKKGVLKPLNFEQRKALLDEYFSKKRKVTKKHVQKYLSELPGYDLTRDADGENTNSKGKKDKKYAGCGISVTGMQKKEEFVSSLKTFIDFKHILEIDENTNEGKISTYLDDWTQNKEHSLPNNKKNTKLPLEEIENIVSICTVFSDRKLRRQRLEKEYGDLSDKQLLTKEQAEEIGKWRFTGWGRFSDVLLRKLQSSIKLNTQSKSNSFIEEKGVIQDKHEDPAGSETNPREKKYSILELLYKGTPKEVAAQQEEYEGSPLLLNVILWSPNYEFQKLIEDYNGDQKELTLEDYQGSPSVRRGISQAIKIVEELVQFAGYSPRYIALESTRSDGEKGRITNSRYAQLKKIYDTSKKEINSQVYEDLNKFGTAEEKKKLNKDKFYLYFTQLGQDAYSGKGLDINHLENCDIDHIYPRSLRYDNSLDDRVLILKTTNVRKSDEYPLNETIQNAMRSRWSQWHKMGLISDIKYQKLMRTTPFTEEERNQFLNRQLVETSQIVRFTRDYLMSKKWNALAFTPSTLKDSSLEESKQREDKKPRILLTKASLSSAARRLGDIPKSRDISDWHHAYDAFLATQVIRFLDTAFPQWDNGHSGFLKKLRERIKEEVANSASNTRKYRDGILVQLFMENTQGSKWHKEHGGEGESFRELLDKTARYNNCHVTRLLSEVKGQFWNETIYSPSMAKIVGNKEKTKGVTVFPLKNVKDKRDFLIDEKNAYRVSLGGKSSRAFSSYSIIQDKKGKLQVNGNLLCFNNSKKVAENANSANNKVILEDGSEATIVSYLEKLYIGQPVFLGNAFLMFGGKERFYVLPSEQYSQHPYDEWDKAGETSKNKERSPLHIESIIKNISTGKDVDDSDYIRLYEWILNEFERRYENTAVDNIANVVSILREGKQKFDEGVKSAIQGKDGKELNKYKKALLSLLNYLRGTAATCDLGVVGGVSGAGGLGSGYWKLIQGDSPAYLIYQSITGLYEKYIPINISDTSSSKTKKKKK